MDNSTYLETDEAHEVSYSIQHAVFLIDNIKGDPYMYKWILLALHSALQGACIGHLVRTDGVSGIVTPRSQKEWMTFLHEGIDQEKATVPKTIILAMPDLLKAIRKPGSCGGDSLTNIELTDNELHCLKKIHSEIRNQFIHFNPLSWSLEVSGIPKLGALIARIIEDIDAANWAFRHLEEDIRSRMIDELKFLRSADWGIKDGH